MRTIYKYPIEIVDTQSIELPYNFKIIRVGLDPQNTPCVWAIIDTNYGKNDCILYIVGTGREIPLPARKHIGSFQQNEFIWHCFID